MMVTAVEGHRLWRAELKSPTSEERRLDRPTDPLLMQGRWRIIGPRTGIDTPVAIWAEEGKDAIFQKGRKTPIVTTDDGVPTGKTESPVQTWQRFVDKDWLKCIAVSVDDYTMALTTGKWPDGKIAREFTDAEKLDIIPDKPAAEGGNNPVGEDGESVDLFHQQIVEKASKAMLDLKAVKFPLPSLEVAEKLAGIIETMRGLGKQGEPRRKEEKQPHLDAAAAVDGKWAFLRDLSAAVQNGVTAIDAFKRAEEARLRREAEIAAAAERERLRLEAVEAARKQAEQDAAEALAHGQAFEEPTEEAIAEQAEAEADQAMAAAPAPDVNVRVSTPHGRAVSKTKKKVGVITDKAAFIAALTGQADFDEWLQEKSNKLARAGTALNGMRIETE
jgi:hypothetical protein